MAESKSKLGREELIKRVQTSLKDCSKKEAQHVIDLVVSAIEETLIANLANNGFFLKLNRLAKLTVRHKPGIYRKIPFTGETKMTKAKRKIKFTALGQLRKQEVEVSKENK